jgi:hypothetical protein
MIRKPTAVRSHSVPTVPRHPLPFLRAHVRIQTMVCVYIGALTYDEEPCPDLKRCRERYGRSLLTNKCPHSHHAERFYHPRSFRTRPCERQCDHAATCGFAHDPAELRYRRPQVYAAGVDGMPDVRVFFIICERSPTVAAHAFLILAGGRDVIG